MARCKDPHVQSALGTPQLLSDPGEVLWGQEDDSWASAPGSLTWDGAGTEVMKSAFTCTSKNSVLTVKNPAPDKGGRQQRRLASTGRSPGGFQHFHLHTGQPRAKPEA